jgi:hypothetical protein
MRLSACCVIAAALVAACGGKADTTDTTDGGTAGAAGSAGAGGAAGSSGTGGAGGAGGAGGSAGAAGSAGSAGVDWSACDGPGQCVIAAPGCCGDPCGQPPLTAYDGVNEAYLQDHHDATCDSDGGVGCPGCMSQRDPHFGARCNAGHCQPFDIRDYAQCTTDSDCMLRFGVGCCPGGCDLGQIVSVSKDAETKLTDWMCGPNPPPCASCPMPSGYLPACINGVCGVVGAGG